MSTTNKPGLSGETPKGELTPASSLTPGALLAAPGVFFTNSQIFFWGVFIVTLVLWASAFVAIPIALKDMTASQVITTRLVISFLIFLPVVIHAWPKVIRPQIRRDWKLLLLLGFTGITLYMFALTYGQRTIGAGETSLIVNMTPLATGFFAALFLKEAFRKRMIFGALVALLGVAFLVLSRGGGLQIDPNALLILAAVISASIYYIIQRKLRKRYSPTLLAALTFFTGTLFALPFSAPIFESFAAMTWRSGGAVVYLGAIASTIAYIGWAFILSKMPAGKAALYLYYIPVLSTIMGWLILDETITFSFLFAGVLIILGVMVGTGVIKANPFRKSKKASKAVLKEPCKDAP